VRNFHWYGNIDIAAWKDPGGYWRALNRYGIPLVLISVFIALFITRKRKRRSRNAAAFSILVLLILIEIAIKSAMRHLFSPG
jgi:predicted branched-subunit amino acid permease